MNAPAVAKEFCQFMNWWLSAKDLAEVVRRNEAETNPNICHSHDFIDANEAMLAAFQNFDLDATDNLELWNEAWDLAKEARFNPDLVGETKCGS